MQVIKKLEWGKYAGASENKQSAIHNWFVYRHSFGKSLVSEILNELKLDSKDKVLDPFCGCGTTLLVCKEKGIESVGMDLMPLSIIVSRAKTHNYSIKNLKCTLKKIESALDKINLCPRPDISIINKAFSQELWNQIQSAREVIERYSSGNAQDFFLTALLAIVPKFGAYSNDGGFPRVTNKPKFASQMFKPMFLDNVERMIKEIESYKYYNRAVPRIFIGDARELQNGMDEFEAIISSPPYPNRQDYTRVYAVELGTAFMKNNDELKELRKRLFRSHIEAKPNNEDSIIDEIETFQEIFEILLKSPKLDKRIPAMLRAYFQDMEKALKSILKVLKSNGLAAIVVGNVRFSGVMIPVDEITASIGKKVGFPTQEIWVTRYRGNSPQQMGEFGKMAARESIVIFRKRV